MTKVDYPEKQITLQKCSENDSHEPVTSLQNLVYCFDDFSQSEGNKYRRKKKLSSADGLYIDRDGKLFFFEFKNVPHNQVPYKGIHEKMHDSIITWQICQASDKSLDELMANSAYFVIYNDSHYKGKRENKSLSMDKFKNQMKTLAKKDGEEILWGLDLYLNTFYKEVHTIDVAVFEKEYAPKIFC